MSLSTSDPAKFILPAIDSRKHPKGWGKVKDDGRFAGSMGGWVVEVNVRGFESEQGGST